MNSIGHRFDSVTSTLTVLAICSTLVGIAPAQILLASALLSFLLAVPFRATFRIESPPILLPFCFFLGFTVLSLLLSPEPGMGWAALNKFWLFCIVVLVVNNFKQAHILWTYYGLFLLGGVSAILSILQFFFLARNTVQFRVTGFMGHWMTLSGEMMLVFICLAAYVVLAMPKRRTLWIALLGLFGIALAVTLTRSVWIATATGLLLILLMRHFHWKTLIIAGLALTLVVAVAPNVLQRRLRSIFDPTDPSNYARTAIWKAGLRMIEAHPWFGVGPQRIYRVFYDYHLHPEDRNRDGFFPVHLHNDLLQFAAERGVPCAVAWLWLMIKLGLDHWKAFRREAAQKKETQAIPAIGFVSVVVLFIAGFFEFNFGDSEVLMIFLFLASAPYALRPRLGTVDERG